MTRDRAFAEELFGLFAEGLIEFEEGDDERGPHVRPTLQAELLRAADLLRQYFELTSRASRPAGAPGRSRGHGEKGGQHR